MVIVVAAALAATLVPQAKPVSPGQQAQATVTILTSASLRFSDIDTTHPKKLRESRVRAADGSVTTVKLIEFE